MWTEIKTVVDLKNATAALCHALEERLVPQDKIFDCRLIVNELVGNVLRHSDGYASLRNIVEPGRIEIYIRSTQAFFPPIESRCSPVTAEGGRGLFLVDSVSISRTVTDEGDIKVVVKY